MFDSQKILRLLKAARRIPSEQEARRQRAWQMFAVYLLDEVPEQNQTYQFTRSMFEWLCYENFEEPLTQEIGTLFIFLREHTVSAHLLYLYGMVQGVAYERRSLSPGNLDLLPVQGVPSAQQKPLSKQDVLALAQTFQQQEKLLHVLRIVEMAYGKECQSARVILQGGDSTLGGSIRYRHLDSLTVFDPDGNELSPDFHLPFWQERPDLDLILAQPGDACYNDAVDCFENPAEGTPSYRLAAAIDALIHEEYGQLDAKAWHEINLASIECQTLLHLPFPQLFEYITIPSSTASDK